MNDDAPWVVRYPRGVPAEVDVARYASVPALMEESFTKHAGACAYLGMGTALSFGDVGRLSRDFGVWLQAQGLQRGDRVALMMPNVLAYPVATAAVLRAGLVVVNVNPLYTPRELEHQLRDSGASAILILENFAATLQQVLDRVPLKLVVVTSMGDLQPLLERGAGESHGAPGQEARATVGVAGVRFLRASVEGRQAHGPLQRRPQAE